MPIDDVSFHREHPRPLPFESQFEDYQPQPWPGFTPPADESGSPESKQMRKRFLEYAGLVENTE
jgi:hypothetical protein